MKAWKSVEWDENGHPIPSTEFSQYGHLPIDSDNTDGEIKEIQTKGITNPRLETFTDENK